MITLAERTKLIKPSVTLAIAAKAGKLRSEGVDVVNFSAGEPDFDTPDHIKAAAVEALRKGMGRKKVKKRWGARIIDLDILLYDALVVKKKTLRIPHPEMPNRKFVLVPLSEIAPQVIHPELGVTISDLLVNVKDDKKVHLYHS